MAALDSGIRWKNKDAPVMTGPPDEGGGVERSARAETMTEI